MPEPTEDVYEKMVYHHDLFIVLAKVKRKCF